MTGEAILLVDDELRVLSSLGRSLLFEDFSHIKTAQSGMEALEIVKNTPNLAVIVSDFQMPVMNGVDFLAKAHAINGDATRILLTGVADLEMAADVVNRGNIFRLLVKPCPADVFLTAVKEGINQNKLVTAERVLLTNTLNGSIKLMVDILTSINPEIFAKASRLRKLASEIAKAMHLEEQAWEIELSALLCQIGAVTIPRTMLVKWQTGKPLDISEREMIRSIPKVGAQLMNNIPRLENIAKAVKFQDCLYLGQSTPENPTGANIPIAARILKIIIDYDHLMEANRTPADAFQILLKQEREYDPQIFAVFEKSVLQIDRKVTMKPAVVYASEIRVAVDDLKLGMELTRDINDKNGILIFRKGTMITEVMKYKLSNYFRTHSIVDLIYVENK